MVTLNQS